MVPIARRNLFAEKGRFVMSVGGVAFAVLLILIVVSLYRGWSRTGSIYRELPGEVWVSQAGTSDPYHSTSLLPEGRAALLARVPGVAAVVPVYSRHLAFPTGRGNTTVDAYVMAFAIPAGAKVPAALRPYLPAPGHAVIGRGLARDAGVAAGGTLLVLGRRLVVDRLLDEGNKIVQFAFLNPSDGKPLLGEPGRVSYFALETKPRTDVSAVARGAVAVVPGAEAHTREEFARAFSRLVTSGFLSVVGVLVAIGFVVGGAVIALTTYTATVEKARDYGVLKALGASESFIYRIVVWQSLLVGLAGSLLGIVAAGLTANVAARWVPEFVTDLRLLDTLGVFGAAILMSIVAAFVPVHRLNRIDPAIVFRA
jgi:putative ABC transport system permease protein